MPKPLTSNIETGPGQGAGRPGPPGPPGSGFSAGLDLTGTSKEQTVIGFRSIPLSDNAPLNGQAYVYNSSLGEFVPATAGGGGTVPALSRYLFVDAGTAVAGPSQDGSVGKPFSTIQAAVAAAYAGAPSAAWEVLVVPGTYAENISFPEISSLTIDGGDASACLIGLTTSVSTVTGGGTFLTKLTVKNATVSGAMNLITSTFGVNLLYDNVITVPPGVGQKCIEQTGGAVAANVTITGSRSSVSNVDVDGTLSVSDGSFSGTVICSTLTGEDGTISPTTVSLSGTTVDLRNCVIGVATAYTFSSSAGTVFMDGLTNYWANKLVVSISNGWKSVYENDVWTLGPLTTTSSSSGQIIGSIDLSKVYGTGNGVVGFRAAVAVYRSTSYAALMERVCTVVRETSANTLLSGQTAGNAGTNGSAGSAMGTLSFVLSGSNIVNLTCTPTNGSSTTWFAKVQLTTAPPV